MLKVKRFTVEIIVDEPRSARNKIDYGDLIGDGAIELLDSHIQEGELNDYKLTVKEDIS